ncbi:MAG: hypothetical protein MJ109_05830 [Kiritimatiellae bacterium]|nr:hypothetical protein [Kiritimatiellia bacterium]
MMIAVGASAPAAEVTPYSQIIDFNDTSSSAYTLTNGIYRIPSSLTRTSTYGWDCLQVAEKNTAVIYIPRGVTLEVNGGDARPPSKSGSEGGSDLGEKGDKIHRLAGDYGGAGIFVPTNSTLIVTGEGTLIARGGNAADGMKGFKADDAVLTRNKQKTGGGGKGGWGGGGAGAAIGGRGGHGGEPGEGIFPSEIDEWDYDIWEDLTSGNNNKDGNPGSVGGNGYSSGNIYLLGTIEVRLAGGKAGTNGGEAGSYTGGDWDYWSNDWFAGPGGGGGGGGSGMGVSYAIGGGAGGGGGGGSGATGHFSVFDDHEDQGYTVSQSYVRGGGGEGGKGFVNGKEGLKNPNAQDQINKRKTGGVGKEFVAGNNGGAGGVQGENGKDGKLFIMPTVTNIVCEVDKQAIYSTYTVPTNGFECIQYKLTFQITGDQIEVVKQPLGCAYPVRQTPHRDGYEFLGYFTGRNGTGDMYYDKDCNFVQDFVYNRCEAQTLYASWQLQGQVDEHIVVESGVTLEWDGTIDNQNLMQPTDKGGNLNLFTIEKGGKLILKNVSVAGSDKGLDSVIKNFGELIVSNCVFQNNYSPFGTGAVYRDKPGAKAVFYGCSFKGNSAIEGGVISAEGSSVSVVSSSFFGNFTTIESDDNSQLEGAAILAIDGAKINVVGCTFADNKCNTEFKVGTSERGRNVALFGPSSTYPTKAQFLNNISIGGNTDNDNSASLYLSEGTCTITAESNFCRKEADSVLGPVITRKISGVEHVARRPLEIARTGGAADNLYHNGDFTDFAIGKKSGISEFIAADQFGQHPIEGWYGAITGNTLQYLINNTPEGGTLVVPEGRYDPVYVDKTIHIVGENRENTYVDGELLESCVTIKPSGANCSWTDFMFFQGKGTNGGGISAPESYGAFVTNCVFSYCSATNGAGAAYLNTASQCVFDQCVANTDGGGIYKAKLVDRSLFVNCIAAEQGGGLFGVDEVRASLISQNRAKRGGGGYDSKFYNCTFDRNVAYDGEACYNAVGNSRLTGCLLYNNTLPTKQSTDAYTFNNVRVSAEYKADKFYDAPRDFHLKMKNYDERYNTRTLVDHSKICLSKDDTDTTNRAENENWLDFEGNPLVSRHSLTGERFMYAGCYAYAPYKTSGMVVTGTEEWYDNTNAMTSLREAIEAALNDPAYMTNEVATVTFSDKLTVNDKDTAIILTLGESQIEVEAFTNRTLVIEGPTDRAVAINGNAAFRAFRVFPENNLKVKNLIFQNCVGATQGAAPNPPMHGGAILNYGNLDVTNCVFVANSSGLSNNQPAGYGGAIATMSGGNTSIKNSSFAYNRAQRGGALYADKNTKTDVFFSTLGENIAIGTGSIGTDGGAIASDIVETNNMANVTLVNCTLVGNSVPASSGTGGAISAHTGLYLLDSILLGNTCGGVTNDLALAGTITKNGGAHIISSVIGSKTKESIAVKYTNINLYEPEELAQFISTTNAVPSDTVLPHITYPVSQRMDDVPVKVIWSEKDNALGYYKPESTRPTAIRGGITSLSRNGVVFSADQTGAEIEANKPIFGATIKVAQPEFDRKEEKPEEEGEPENPEDPTVAAKVIITDYLGNQVGYKTAEEAIVAFKPGDKIEVVDEEDDDSKDALDAALYTKYESFAKDHPWFDFVATDDFMSYSVTLNDEAKPVAGDLEIEYSPDEVAVRTLENMKPGLWYALGVSDSPAGPFVATKWIMAKEDSFGEKLDSQEPLSAPKNGASGFYRVIVAPYPPVEK